MSTQRLLTTDEMKELSRAVRGRAGHHRMVAKPVSPYDLARPSRLPKSKTDALETILRATARSWTDETRQVFGDDTVVALASLERMTFRDFAGALSGTGLIVLADAGDMSKAAGIELPADLALGVVNRMAGGAGKNVPSARDLTRIEVGIARGFVGRLYEGLSAAWHRALPVTFKPATQCRSAGEVGWRPDQALAIARMKCRVGAWDSEIAIVLRSELLDQLPDDDGPRREKRAPATSERRNAEEVRNMLGHVPVDMAADLGHARLTLRDVLGMQVGDVLRLDRSVGQAIPFKIGRRPGFEGRPGLSGNRLSVRIEGKTFQADAENAISPIGASQNPIEE